MSARDNVLTTMRYSEEWFSGSAAEFEADIASQLDAYKAQILHEAAEQIRAHAWEECGYGDTNCPCDAADLIDPGVA
jgi:hypothetical protein